jgi:hypothetical protein
MKHNRRNNKPPSAASRSEWSILPLKKRAVKLYLAMLNTKSLVGRNCAYPVGSKTFTRLIVGA